MTHGMEEQRFAVILAGGSGTRLWPLSRSLFPKQLLCLDGAHSLLQDTAQRLLELIPARRIYTVTRQDHRLEIAAQLRAVDPELAANLLAEPVGRNTLPAVAWALATIARSDPAAVVGVFPADHRIIRRDEFHKSWHQAVEVAATGRLVTFGIQPTAPETGYGYVQTGAPLPGFPDTVHAVARFVEKPDAATAAGFLRSGEFLWNSGMFVLPVREFFNAVEEFEPEIATGIAAIIGSDAPLATGYPALPAQSIDYGIMERAANVAVVTADLGWSDLGSWEAFYLQGEHDAEGNLRLGDTFCWETSDSLVVSTSGFLATLGVENLVVVKTADTVLIASRRHSQEVKRVVEHLQRTNSTLAREHLTIQRPWGSYTILEQGPGYKIKRIEVNPGARLSLQMHHHRSEHWVVVSGTAKVQNGDTELFLAENESTYIPKTVRHRLENPGVITLQMIEVQSGAYLGEDDIVRFADNYGRVEGEEPRQR